MYSESYLNMVIFLNKILPYSYGVLENVDKAQTKVRARNENVAGIVTS